MNTLRQDAAHSLRALRRNPGFTITAVLTLALGIGANTAIFTVMYGVLLKPLSYPAAERLVRVTGGATVARSEAIQRARAFSSAASFLGVTESVTLSGVDSPEALTGARVSAAFLDTLGIAPLAGRGFSTEEETPGRDVAMISTELWQRLFHSDSGVIGRTVTLAAAPHTIIGVLPKGFQFPSPGVDLWRPLQPGTMPIQARLNSPVLGVVARLKPDVSVEQAGAEVAVINRQYALANPGKLDANAKQQAERLVPLKEYLVRNVRSILWLLFGAVAFLLIIACANVASLFLARTTERGREFAIRAALGAGRKRLVQQLLTESLMLAVAGGACGLALAKLGLDGIARLPGLELPRSGEIHMDGPVFAFALLAAFGSTILFGLAPSLIVSRPDLTVAMKASGESADLALGGYGKSLWLRLRGLLVVAQVALSMVLLIGSALLLESLARLSGVNPGFQPENVLTMKIGLPQSRLEELVQRVESIPGVQSASVTLTLPLTGWAGTPVQKAGDSPLNLNERPIAILQSVSPGYFRTMGIAMRRGRDFAARDSQSARPVAVISESLAKRFWPSYPAGEDPIGRFMFAGASKASLEVIGIVGDVRHSGLGEAANDGIYRPRAQMPQFPAMFAVRTIGNPLALVNAVRREVTAIDPNQAIAAVKTMGAVVEASEGQRRSILVLLELFAATGLALAIVGVYGVIAYSVALRTRELGIRRALGAQPGDVVQLVLRQGFGLALAGVGLGVAGAVALSRVLRGLLFEVSPTDPTTYGVVAVGLLLAAAAATYVPARRAARIEPTVALRS